VERQLDWISPHLVTACEIDGVGRLVLVLSGYRVVVYDPSLGVPTWSYDLHEAVKQMGIADGHAVVVTERGTVYEFAVDRPLRASGWVHSVEQKSAIAGMWDNELGLSRTRQVTCLSDVGDLRLTPRIVGPGTVTLSLDSQAHALKCGTSDAGPLRPGDLLVGAGTLVLNGVAQAAAVFVDDAFVGKGQREIAGLEPGKHSVRVYEQGKVPFVVLTHVDAYTKVELQVSLQPAAESTLRLRTDPQDAEIYLDRLPQNLERPRSSSAPPRLTPCMSSAFRPQASPRSLVACQAFRIRR
jgi:hypothetical protein